LQAIESIILKKRKSEYEKNDANADIAIKNVKIQPTLSVVC